MTPVTNKEDKASAVGGKDSSPGKKNTAFPGDDGGVSNILGSPFPSDEEEENHPTAGNRRRSRQEDEDEVQGRAKVQKTDDDDDDKKPAAVDSLSSTPHDQMLRDADVALDDNHSASIMENGDDDDRPAKLISIDEFWGNPANRCQDGETIPEMLVRSVPKRDKECGISPIVQRFWAGFHETPTTTTPNPRSSTADENAMETHDSQEGAADSPFTTPRLGPRRMPSPSSSRIPELDSPLPAPSKENDDGEEE